MPCRSRAQEINVTKKTFCSIFEIAEVNVERVFGNVPKKLSEETFSSERKVGVEEAGERAGDLSLYAIFNVKAMMP